MQARTKQFIGFAIIPLLILFIYTTLFLIYRFFNLPTQQEILGLAEQYYKQYGYWVVLVSALIEGVLLVNWYFPGSVVIVLGVSLTYPDPWKALFLLTLVTIGFFISAIINYALGKYGWYRLFLKFGLKEPLENMKNKLQDRGLSIIFSSYIHPNLGALTATSAGILGLPFTKFILYSLVALSGWNLFWGVIAFAFGGRCLNTYLI